MDDARDQIMDCYDKAEMAHFLIPKLQELEIDGA